MSVIATLFLGLGNYPGIAYVRMIIGGDQRSKNHANAATFPNLSSPDCHNKSTKINQPTTFQH